MTRFAKEAKTLVNPVQLADDAVLALASLERGGELMPELLSEGIKLCDYLITLLKELKTPADRRPHFAFRAVDADERSLQESKVNSKEVEEMREKLCDLLKDPTSHAKEEVRSIQEFLMRVTMPMWQYRAAESQERKLKRGVIVRD